MASAQERGGCLSCGEPLRIIAEKTAHRAAKERDHRAIDREGLQAIHADRDVHPMVGKGARRFLSGREIYAPDPGDLSRVARDRILPAICADQAVSAESRKFVLFSARARREHPSTEKKYENKAPKPRQISRSCANFARSWMN